MRRLLGYDSALLAATLGILGFSIYVLATATASGHADSSYGVRQAVFAGIGIVVAWLCARLDLARFEAHWLRLYLLCVGSIAAVLLLGSVARGSRRWITIGSINLQPSEIGKVLVILAVAGFVTARLPDLQRARGLVAVLGLVALPALLVFVQPDFGTSQIYAAIALALALFAGARWLHLGIMFGSIALVIILVLGVLPAAGIHVLKPYQSQRFTGFLHPESDPEGSNYHEIQAKIAIGSGQLTGKPKGETSQVGEGFLPEPHTDFVFATLSEQEGFVGGALLIALYLLLISRCLRAVQVAPTRYSQLVCGAIACMFGAQVFINIGMCIGLMPVTGVPLPLFSYGGSAMIADLAAIGLVAGVFRASESAPVRYARRVGGISAAAHRSQHRRGRIPV